MSVLSPSLTLAKARVDTLLQAQHCLRAILGASKAEVESPKVAELRHLLGKAVRTQTEQQQEIEELRAALREERTASQNAQHASCVALSDAEALRKQLQQVQAELADERNERMESEAASMEREEQLQARVDELEEEERRRLAIEKAMAEAEPPPEIPPSLQVQVAPPPPAPVPCAGFDASAGGFSL